MLTLYIQPTNSTSAAFYKEAAAAYLAKPLKERDAGFDTFVGESCVGKQGDTQRLDLGCRAAVYDPQLRMFRAYWLLPRSSISKSPLRMANSVGLIDAGYRGVLMGAVDFRSDHTANVGERYFQITGPTLLPWDDIKLVDEIPGGPTDRGEGGFGSTGLGLVAQLDPKNVAQSEPKDIGYFI